ncbi:MULTISPECIES: arsenic resistance protein [Staphylococcus]|uniref:Arsenic resistance protein n=3 Tax=Staphylococcus cohnii TaxID=29382 RepID=A0A2T4LRX6_9STAP|nr:MULTISPECIES: arsenic resistance protein [Staphylococcus]MCE5035114.1 arsenic resistance protein [Staphylococcus cohnii]PTF17160.1 arsenic resistance protein [Staphylococcus cohnii]PTF22340.1 arsenic resistance protein [Staphylococcus cohnii]PTF33240.1 arsenic resistance protein [Staphylococcus cohnii]PTF66093.1 arsenic resistance protein [Staphylococcus cohnii]
MQYIKSMIEKYQIYIYFIALLSGVLVGLISNIFANILESIISASLFLLMFSMFSQIPFFNIKHSLLNIKSILALLISNFIVIPLFVYGLIQLFDISDAPILIGLYLVLLTPCIDYVLVFNALGKGNERLMLFATPLLFICQILLLPLYFTLFLNTDIFSQIDILPFFKSFLMFIIFPLLLALLLQYSSNKSKNINQILKFTSWLPEIFMALVLFSIVGSQINKIIHNLNIVITVIPIYICFLIIAPLIGTLCGKLFKVTQETKRTIAFSSSTRNALVVLPLALGLPNHWVTITTTVIITQTLCELLGELIYIKMIPKYIK